MDPSKGHLEEGKHQGEEGVMLDQFVFRRDGGAKLLPENETTASSSTCIGVPFRVSVGLVSPPSTSRFYLEWPGGPHPDATIPCQLAAAHRDCVLFRLTSIARTKTRPRELIFPDDYYVYTPAAAHLKRLPTCIRAKPVEREQTKQEESSQTSDSESSEPESSEVVASESSEPESSEVVDSESSEPESSEVVVIQEMIRAEQVGREHYERRLALGVQVDEEVVRSSLVMENIGFLCGGKGGGEFVVAELLLDKSNRHKVSAELSLLRSGTCEWVHMPQLPIQCKNKRDSAALRCFYSQAAVPFGDSLCWVDHGNGIIIGQNMLGEKVPNMLLSYIPLPRTSPIRCEDDRRRRVCATDGGSSLKFIDVVVDKQPPCGTRFTILSYKLLIATEEEGRMLKWEKEASITSEEFWRLQAPGRVPQEVPMFPLVSLDNPQIVHFQLSECTDYIDTVTLVTIDMDARTVVSVLTHIKGEQELHGEDADVAEARSSFLLPFLSATFSKSTTLYRPANLTRKRKEQSYTFDSR